MKKLNILLLIFVLTFFAPVFLGAVDFGLVINNAVSLENDQAEDTIFEYRADLLPRISFLIGETGDFTASAGLTLGVKDGKFVFTPELLNTEISFHPGVFGISAGRMYYADPLSFVAEGLFDGFRVTYASNAGTLGLGAWYTGLIYKKNANIAMTANDRKISDSVLDYGKFVDTYFAPRRLLASLDWHHPSIAELLRLSAAITGQFDLSGSDNKNKYSSQYFTLKAGLPVNSLLFELGGAASIAQVETEGETDSAFSLAAYGGFFWNLPTPFNSRLAITGIFGSGNSGNIDAYIPLTAKQYGKILQPTLSALTVIGLDYSARLAPQVGAGISANYFIRNDDKTYNNFATNEGTSDKLLGPEFSANVTWSPVSDLQLVLGGGVFIPAMGNAMTDSKPLWRIDLSVVLAVF